MSTHQSLPKPANAKKKSDILPIPAQSKSHPVVAQPKIESTRSNEEQLAQMRANREASERMGSTLLIPESVPHTPPPVQPKQTKGQSGEKKEPEADIQPVAAPIQSHPVIAQPKIESTLSNEEQLAQMRANREASERMGSTLLIPESVPHTPPQPPLQPKLTIGQPNDPYEQEADRVARQVVNHINAPPKIQAKTPRNPMSVAARKPSPLAHHPAMTVQRYATGGEMDASPNLESSIQRARGGGHPLDNGIRARMEGAFGADFSGVRVHTDGTSDQLNQSIQAKAFTTGQDVFFRKGAYEPGSRGGQELLAHELTHVVQQSRTLDKSSTIGNTQNTNKIQRYASEDPNYEPVYDSFIGGSGVQVRLGHELRGGSKTESNVPEIIKYLRQANWKRGHLLGQELGGFGDEIKNITVLSTTANNTHRGNIENKIKELLEHGRNAEDEEVGDKKRKAHRSTSPLPPKRNRGSIKPYHDYAVNYQVSVKYPITPNPIAPSIYEGMLAKELICTIKPQVSIHNNNSWHNWNSHTGNIGAEQEIKKGADAEKLTVTDHVVENVPPYPEVETPGLSKDLSHYIPGLEEWSKIPDRWVQKLEQGRKNIKDLSPGIATKDFNEFDQAVNKLRAKVDQLQLNNNILTGEIGKLIPDRNKAEVSLRDWINAWEDFQNEADASKVPISYEKDTVVKQVEQIKDQVKTIYSRILGKPL